MAVDTRVAREREAMRRQEGTHLQVDAQPDARAMGAESAEYTEPTIDPQWIDAWKMFVDRDGNEYGIPVKLPRGQWSAGGPNALENQRRPDGGYWFTLVEPERKATPPQYECFVGECTKMLDTRSKLVGHVEAFHFTEASTYTVILQRIKEQVAEEDPRFQRLLASLEAPPQESTGTESEAVLMMNCELCGATSPEGHKSPGGWLRGHKLGAHKESK